MEAREEHERERHTGGEYGTGSQMRGASRRQDEPGRSEISVKAESVGHILRGHPETENETCQKEQQEPVRASNLPGARS